jgi:hypothetical protein
MGPLKGNARRPVLLDSLMPAQNSASRRGASGVGPTSSGRIPGRVGGAAVDSHHGEHERTTEFHGAVAARSDDKAAETVFDPRGVEVHQPADAKMVHAEVGEKLGFTAGSFNSENDGVFDHDIGAKAQWDRYTSL